MDINSSLKIRVTWTIRPPVDKKSHYCFMHTSEDTLLQTAPSNLPQLSATAVKVLLFTLLQKMYKNFDFRFLINLEEEFS